MDNIRIEIIICFVIHIFVSPSEFLKMQVLSKNTDVMLGDLGVSVS